MFVAKALISLALCVCVCQRAIVHVSASAGLATSASEELNTCEEQLMKYRKFLLQAIISFEDVCDAYNTHLLSTGEAMYHAQHDQDAVAAGGSPAFLRNYQPAEQRSEIWAFFKLLMAQFNDLEFTNVIREAVIERCRVKSQLQRDEKRNSVVLGKKQRFHSWGGKRSSALLGSGSSSGGGNRLAAQFGTGTLAAEDDRTYYN